jgi:hypothetical protein
MNSFSLSFFLSPSVIFPFVFRSYQTGEIAAVVGLCGYVQTVEHEGDAMFHLVVEIGLVVDHAVVVGLLHLDEDKRQTVHHQRDIGAELLVTIDAGHLGGAHPSVVLRMVIVDQPDAIVRRQPLSIGLASQIFIVQADADLTHAKIRKI